MSIDKTPRPSIPDAARNFELLPDSAEVPARVVAAIFNVSIPTVWRYAKVGILPRPRKLSAQATRWRVGELRATQRAMQQNPAQPRSTEVAA